MPILQVLRLGSYTCNPSGHTFWTIHMLSFRSIQMPILKVILLGSFDAIIQVYPNADPSGPTFRIVQMLPQDPRSPTFWDQTDAFLQDIRLGSFGCYPSGNACRIIRIFLGNSFRITHMLSNHPFWVIQRLLLRSYFQDHTHAIYFQGHTFKTRSHTFAMKQMPSYRSFFLQDHDGFLRVLR